MINPSCPVPPIFQTLLEHHTCTTSLSPPYPLPPAVALSQRRPYTHPSNPPFYNPRSPRSNQTLPIPPFPSQHVAHFPSNSPDGVLQAPDVRPSVRLPSIPTARSVTVCPARRVVCALVVSLLTAAARHVRSLVVRLCDGGLGGAAVVSARFV